MWVATQSTVSELSESSLLTSMWTASLQFPKIYNFLCALATPRKKQCLGWAVCPSQEIPLWRNHELNLKFTLLSNFVGTLSYLNEHAFGIFNSSQGRSNVKQDNKLVNEFYACFNGQDAYPFRDHLLNSYHLETCGFQMNGFRSSCNCCVGAMHLETHTRSQTPHFMSYPMDMTTSGIFLAKCHIHVISMSYLFFKKDIFGYTWYIQN